MKNLIAIPLLLSLAGCGYDWNSAQVSCGRQYDDGTYFEIVTFSINQNAKTAKRALPGVSKNLPPRTLTIEHYDETEVHMRYEVYDAIESFILNKETMKLEKGVVNHGFPPLEFKVLDCTYNQGKTP